MQWKKELQPSIEWIDRLLGAKTTSEIGAILRQFVARFGADYILAGIVPRQGLGPKDQESHVLLNDFPRPWMEHYFQHNLLAHDPVVKAIVAGSEPFLWQEMMQGQSLSREACDVMKAAAEHGLKQGLTFSIPDLNNHHMGLSIAGERLDISADQRRQLNVIATIAIARLLLLSTTLDVLSSRELQALDLRSKGALLREIAAEMRISRNGVNYLLREARTKLGVAHTTEAIRVCVRSGLLS